MEGKCKLSYLTSNHFDIFTVNSKLLLINRFGIYRSPASYFQQFWNFLISTTLLETVYACFKVSSTCLRTWLRVAGLAVKDFKDDRAMVPANSVDHLTHVSPSRHLYKSCVLQDGPVLSRPLPLSQPSPVLFSVVAFQDTSAQFHNADIHQWLQEARPNSENVISFQWIHCSNEKSTEPFCNSTRKPRLCLVYGITVSNFHVFVIG